MIIGILHSAWTIFIAFYAFIKPIVGTKYDFYYILYILLLVTSWLLMKDECFVTYIYKKWSNPSYVMGADGMDLADAELIFGKDSVRIGIIILMVFTVSSISMVSRRSRLAPFYVWMPFVVCFVIYLFTLRKFFNPKLYHAHLEKWNPVFRTIFLAITLIYLSMNVVGQRVVMGQ